MLATGGAAAAALVAVVPIAATPVAAAALAAAGCAAAWRALRSSSGKGAGWWLAAGLCLVAWRALDGAGAQQRLADRLAVGDPTIRALVVLTDRWQSGRWGLHNRIRISEASLNGRALPFGTEGGVEVRGDPAAAELPAAGAVVEILARVRGSPSRPLLVVSSPRLVNATGDSALLPAIRQWLTDRLMAAAGTDADRIRAAESAAALSLGRRYEIPAERRERWRRSGLAHVLAVSGLHVGLVGAIVWVLAARLAPTPNAARWITIIIIPAYAVLAGGAPSARRAALMAVVYLGARLLGRAILPMAAVLLTVVLLLLSRPALIADPGFQLTVVITAALVRWVPPLARRLPGPQWLAGAAAVPVVAQLAALPLVAWHFRSVIPGALPANLAALPLIAPTVGASVAAAVLAPVWQAAAAAALNLVHLLSTALIWCGSAARAGEIVPPRLPAAAVAGLVASGWLALRPGRHGTIGGMLWILVVLTTALWMAPAASSPPVVELLPVSDGTAVNLRHGRRAVLFDAGRYPLEAARMLADTRIRALDAMVVSHADEDHIGGAIAVLRAVDVRRVLVPAWMATVPESVPLLRAARRRDALPVRIARGVAMSSGPIRIDFLWPPTADPPRHENERSIVARATITGGPILLTSDIGRATELQLARLSNLECAVLVVPHHGSRGSTSSLLLERSAPRIALIPAGEGNRHGHPHGDVLDRLEDRGIITRWPARHGSCGAVWNGREWEAFP